MSIVKIIIPEFKVYTPTTIANSCSSQHLLHLKGSTKKYYSDGPDDFEVNEFHHFPLLVLPNKELWEHVNNYLLSKLESIDLPSSSTLSSIADSIKYFGNYCLDTDIDYLVCTRKSNSPLRRYRRYLSDRISKSKIAASTAKEHISNLVNFYRYLQLVEHVDFEFPPWKDREARILIADTGNGGYIKNVKSSDVSQAIKGKISTKRKREHCTFEGKIIDDGELRPLNYTEQKVLITALKELNNPEMTLIFLIGLCTGARLQTILTLRYDNFSFTPTPLDTEIAVYAGRYHKNGNGLVDSKGDKSITIYFPIELYNKIKLYINSERAVKRHIKYKYQLKDTDLQYLFLSQQGNPLYLSKSDENAKFYRQLPTGQTVTTFIFERLKPKLNDLNFNGSFKFHDTRATFGMNIVNSGLKQIKSSNSIGDSIDQLFRFVKVRMCHSDLSTTQQYLNFNQNNKIVKEAKIGWEQQLSSMLEIADVT
jgi:integrase